MTVERWRQIEHLYHAALEHGTSVLADADPELRRQVEKMLAQDSAGKILDGPAAELFEQSDVTQLDLAGRTIAHYRIVEQLGQGGMGVIWKARDTHLDRFVAFKVLHASKMADPERKRRFIQEAKAASALNHPNIVTIHDIGQAGGIDFIAMELVSGKALSQLIPRKGLRLDDALGYAIQIAEALEAAHAAGIVHRDLKPANVMVNESGIAKVLDFGLAKLTEQSGGSESGRTGTQTEAFQTDEGMIVGTVSYMSPEQAQGKKVDARSDIFSFGGMLYEMIAGGRPFQGDSSLSTLSAIIRDDPKPLTQVLPGLPLELDKIITRCLRKDPARRFQTMADLKVVLQDLKEDVDAGKPAPVEASRPRDHRVLAGVSVALLAVTLAGAWWWKARSGDSPRELAVRAVTADSGLTTDPVLSRDGKLLAYASDRANHNNLDIWIHPLTEGAQPLRLTTNDADDDTPDFSPDGGLIVFHSNRDGGGIYLVPAYGGEERLLVHGGRYPRFFPDGKRIAYSMQHGGTPFLEQSSIYTVPVTGGEAKLLITDVPWAARPVFSADGRQILFEGATETNDLSSHDWWVAPLGGGRSVKTGAFAALANQNISLFKANVGDWVGDQVLFTLQGQVWGMRLSEPDWKPAEPARPLTSGNNTVTGARLAKTSFFAFSNGVLSIHMWRLRLDARSGKAVGEMEPLQHSGGSQRYPSSSADGRLLAYSQVEPGGHFVRLRDLRTGKETTLLTTDGRPKVSPDGSQVAYSVFPDSVYVMPAGGGESALLVPPQGKSSTQIYAWTPDGKKIVYWWGNPIRFSLMDPRTGQSTELMAHAKYNIHGAELAPDQRWVAFNTPINGRQQPLWIAAYRDGKAADEAAWVQVSMDGDERPWWSADGNLLYFVSRRDGNQCIWAQRLDSITKKPAGAAFAVYHLHGRRKMPTGGLAPFGPAVVPDGIIFSLEEETGNVWIAERKE